MRIVVLAMDGQGWAHGFLILQEHSDWWQVCGLLPLITCGGIDACFFYRRDAVII